MMRVMSLVHKNCNEAVPQPQELTSDDEQMLAAARALYGNMQPLLEKQV